MKNWIVNSFGVAFFVISLAYLGPFFDDLKINSEATEQAEKERRFRQAAQAVCGENAAWEEVSPGVVQCYLKNGRKTLRASL